MSRKLTSLTIIVLALVLVQPAGANALDPDLVGWWTFDEGAGAVAADSSATGAHGTLEGGALWRDDGRRQGCLFFEGSQAHVRVPQQEALNPGDGSFTIICWVSVEQTPGTAGDTNWDLPVAKRDSGSIGYYVGADRNQGGADQTGYRFMLGDAGGTRTDTPFVTVPLAEWVFVAAVLDRGKDTQKISIDGGQTWAETTPPSGAITPDRDLGIGWDIGQNNYWFHGRIDDVAFFKRALSDSRIALIMQEGMTPALAKGAQPGDRASDVPRDVTFTWAPGLYAAAHDVYLGTTLEDVSSATRADPQGVLVSEGQAQTTYVPEAPLAYGQTYYWRVDEVNAAPDGTIFTGKVWSFTVEPFAYAVAQVTATSNGIPDAGREPENTIDGSGLGATGAHSSESEDMWAAAPAEGETLHIQFEFDRAYALHELLVWNYNVEFELLLGFGFKDVTIEHSLDGVDWTVLKEVQFAQGTAADDYIANTAVDLEGVLARYVRLTPNTGYGTMGQYGLSEVRFLYLPVQAREPEPADGATGIGLETVLDWRAGRQAASHAVHFGTDPETLPWLDTLAESQYAVGDLDLGMTYYWRIDEVNEAATAGTWEGDVWSFATLEYIEVDNFESYTDNEGSLIYEAWIDGWENETGSQVGYLDAPFAELTIVHGGGQSMPLAYNNTVPLGYSEAERTFDVAQDWTVRGTGTLTIHFRGALDNTGDLYAKIDGTKVAYNGDASHIASVVWRPWNIDLTALGINLRSVQTLALGVEGAGAQGILYIDDIRLYRTPPTTVVPVEPDSAHLIAHYAVDGAATDGSGNGYDGEAVGEPTYGPGVVGQAIQLDGVDDHIRVVHQDRLNPGDGSFSVSLWANLDPTRGSSGATNWDLAVAKRDTGSSGYYIGADRNQGDADQAGWKFMLGNISGNRVDTTFLPVPLGEWVFVVAVLDRDQNVHQISVDGGQSWTAATPPAGSVAPAQDLGIGWDIGQNNYWFHGAIDEVRLYDHALSEEEIAWLAQQ